MGLEIRWFFPGLIPSSVEYWFQRQTSQQFLPAAQKLTDIYLQTWDYNLGLKLRNGSLDVKWRRRYGEFIGAVGKVNGQAEDWIRWVWRDTEGNTGQRIQESIRSDPQSPWIEVTKERLQIRDVFTGNRFIAARPGDQVERGCAIELTNIRVRDKWWWTLALDIFGSGGEATMILHQRAETLFTDYPGPELTLEQSYGYPQWLSSTTG